MIAMPRVQMILRAALLFTGLSCATGALAAGGGAKPPTTAPANLILGDVSQWRCWFIVRPPEVRVGQEVKKVLFNGYGGVWVLPDATNRLPAAGEKPPANWAAADFDDQNWSRSAGPFFKGGRWAWTEEASGAGFCGWEGTSPSLAGICLRGKFNVADPAKAADLKLSLAYRGGVIVYLNGQEIARASMADSEKAKGIDALAEDYAKDVFVTEDGKVIGDVHKCFAQLQNRIRRISDVVVPAKLLRAGPNVLAIEVHRAPFNEAAYGSTGRGKGYLIDWCTVGLPHIELTAPGGGASPNLARPAGVQAWSQDPQVRVKASEYGDPCEPLSPIKVIGARNGSFSGEAVVSSLTAMRGLKAVAGDLTGPGKIDASNIQIRYALDDKDTNIAFDILSPDAPTEVPVDKAAGGAVLPVWVTIKVPPDAKAGEYKGAATITVDGVDPMAVPITLHVVDWQLPDSKAFVGHVGLSESPETVAMKYKVPLWSPEHWKLLDQVFDLLGQVGADDVFITALRRTHHGNEHSMIRWIKAGGAGGAGSQPDGAFRHDFSIAEQYLDLAIKHLGKVPVVCLYCWEPYTGGSYGGGAPTGNKGMLYTLLDPATGKLEEAEGPTWGTPEVREFWKPVFDGMREILKKRDLEKSLMIGVSSDSIPTKKAVEDLKAVAPDVKWVAQTHAHYLDLYGVQKVGYLAEVWNSPRPPDPADKRVYGWKNPSLITAFPRYDVFTLFLGDQPLAQYRLASEGCSTAGIRGFGRVGADFWNVLETPNKTYGSGRNLVARYPESDWGQLYLANSTPYVLAPGPKGPLATARFEMLREGAQDLEARVSLEKALLDATQRARLGDDLAKRCQDLLDERVRANVIGRASWKFFQGGPGRVERLYDLTAEVAGKLGK